jgi:hypothetical protein
MVMLRMRNGRMPGPDGLRGELFKGAYDVYTTRQGRKKHLYHLHGDLSVLFSAVYRCGQVPVGWCSAALSAVFKKGDPSVLDNYRGIAVGSVMGKMFSMLIERRLSDYCEEQGFRARGQAGFRDGHRTCDHVFVLKHLIDRSRIAGGRLFACFVDFQKAYDSVRRDLLMRCLADIGLRGSILTSIVSMYWNAPMVTKLGGRLGQPFDSTRGVKQGDPLSPLLFGIFIDRIERWVADRCASCGTKMGTRLVRLLLYADDLVLLADCPSKLQQLLTALEDFCAEYDMQVNVGKTEIVVFGRQRYDGHEVWQYGGQQVPVTHQFKYLGVVFDYAKGVSVSMQALATAGSRAMWAMLSRCKEHGVRSLAMQVQLFNTLVSPILSYCSEVWGPSLLSQAGAGVALLNKLMDNDLSRVQFAFLRAIAGWVRKSTSRQLLLREFGARNLLHTWLRTVVRMWNRVATMSHSSLLACAMRDNLQLCESSGRRFLWCSQLQNILGYIHAETHLLPDAVRSVQSLRPLPEKVVMQAFDVFLHHQWRNLPLDPRSAGSDQVTFCTYERWFASRPFSELDMSTPASWSAGYVQHSAGLNREHLGSLSRFRLGAHDLYVCTGRWRRPPIARHNRLCDRPGCQTGQVEDEFHMVFECPFYTPVRQHFACLFAPFDVGACGWERPPACSPTAGGPMTRFMDQHPATVAAFVHACHLMRCHPDTDPADILSTFTHDH